MKIEDSLLDRRPTSHFVNIESPLEQRGLKDKRIKISQKKKAHYLNYICSWSLLAPVKRLQILTAVVLLAIFIIYLFWCTFTDGYVVLDSRYEFAENTQNLIIHERDRSIAQSFPFSGPDRQYLRSWFSSVDISSLVNGKREDIDYTSVLNTRSYFLFSDVIALPIDEELGSVVSQTERIMLKNSLLRIDSNRERYSFLADLVKRNSLLGRHVQDDNRLLRLSYPNRSTSSIPFQKFKESVLLYDTALSGWNSACFNTVIDLLLFTGVIEVPTSKGNDASGLQTTFYKLAPPLKIHVHARAIGAFTEFVLLRTKQLEKQEVEQKLKEWEIWKENLKIPERQNVAPPLVPRRFYIITNGDDDTPLSNLIQWKYSGMDANQFVDSLLEHPLLLRWLTQNCNSNHAKMKCIPIGVDFHSWSSTSLIRPETSFFQQQANLFWKWFMFHPAKEEKDIFKNHMPTRENDLWEMNNENVEPLINLKAFLLRVIKLSETNTLHLHFHKPILSHECNEKGEKMQIAEIEKWETIVTEFPQVQYGTNWLPIQYVGEHIRNLLKERKALSLRVYVFAAPLQYRSMQSSSSDGESTAQNCGRLQNPQRKIPFHVQMHCFGIFIEPHFNLVEDPHVHLFIPLPAVLRLALQHLRPPGSANHRSLKISFAFNARNQRKIRSPVYQFLSKNENIAAKGPSNRSEYWTLMQQTLFTASPVGFGYDCHRTWEALLLGCIPIIHHSSVFHDNGVLEKNALINGHAGVRSATAEKVLELFSDLPVVIVKDFSAEISIEQLQRWQQEVDQKRKNGLYKWEKLFSQYWINKAFGMELD